MINFSLEDAIGILERTPIVLDHLLTGFDRPWLKNDEGTSTWSPYDIVGHLIHGEKTDWIPRVQITLSDEPKREFTPFDRFAQLNSDQDRPIGDLLEEFKKLREKNLEHLKSIPVHPDIWNRTAIHPSLGVVRFSQLIATWAVHDLNHIHQITRVLAHQYENEVGPWKAYLGVLNRDL